MRKHERTPTHVADWQVRLGQLIVKLRDEKNLTRAATAKGIGINPTTLLNGEIGKVPLSLSVIYRLEKFLDYPLFEKAREGVDGD